MDFGAPLRIPKNDVPAIRAIMEMPADAFEALISAISNATPTFTPQKLARNILPRLKGFAGPDLFQILNTTCGLYYVKANKNIPADELAESVSQSVVEQAPEKDKPSPEKRQQLRDRLIRLLGLDKTLAVTAKAVDLRTEHERVFCNARILSDIRPVFANSEDSAEAGIIIHNLQIGFHHSAEGGKHQEFYVSLDTEDIQTLKKVIARAEKKTEALKAILAASKITYLEI